MKLLKYAPHLLNPVDVLNLLMDKTRTRVLAIHHNVTAGRHLNVRGKLIIQLCPKAKLILGDNVQLNSRNRGYHINLFAPIKLMADRPGATISIGSNTRIHGSCLHAYKSITIGKNCLIAGNCQIIDASGHDLSMDKPHTRLTISENAKPVIIEDNVWLGTGCIVLPGVTIGQGTVVAAGSVVVKNLPAYCIAGGNPAAVLRQYPPPTNT